MLLRCCATKSRWRQPRSVANAIWRATGKRPRIFSATRYLVSAALPFTAPSQFVHIGHGLSRCALCEILRSRPGNGVNAVFGALGGGGQG
jgi:hypothetical protein